MKTVLHGGGGPLQSKLYNPLPEQEEPDISPHYGQRLNGAPQQMANQAYLQRRAIS